MERATAVIFDLDGTLLDTEAYIVGGFNYAFTKKGYPAVSAKELDKTAGLKLTSVYAKFAPKEDPEEMAALHREFQKANTQLVKPYAGVAELLEELHKNQVTMAIATSRFRPSATELLAKFGFTKYFGATACGSDGFKEKPDPEMFEWCAQKIGVEPAKCVVVGDSPLDIAAGRRAGMKTMRAAYGYAATQQFTVKPDFDAATPGGIARIVLKQRI